MRRGYIFSADIVLAIIIFGVLFVSMQYTAIEAGTHTSKLLQLKQNMDDTLAVLDKESALQEFDVMEITGNINDSLDQRYSWRARKRSYEKGETEFVINGTAYLGDWTTELADKEFVGGNRIALKLDAENKAIEEYYFIEYWGWLN